ncbi:Flp pilus assembly protein CpaB [Microlunatus elymi]|uniref:Flp pilus assembly protein CpaB n=1 Tax=Microlunatus elymi TaxID=2596828 RepID=A0A516PZK3_9ACTN|nr:Flp pilus assembly protein CpaB [Microlunatus elymi]QDP96615.1 Flp pilus assembly protein CpaB [Microlunatus elymi]
MNPRQRRGVLLMVLAAVAAVVVFVGVSTYVGDVNSKVGPTVTVYQVTKDLPAFTTLSNKNTEPVQVPERYAAANTKLQAQAIDGQVTAVPLTAGAAVSTDVLVPQSDLDPDEREVAVNVNAVTGLVGRIKPGDRVDVYATFADVPGLPQQARILVENVRVVSIEGQKQVPSADKQTMQDVIPVTLALKSDAALSVTYANSFAKEVRLVGLPSGVAQDRSGEEKTYDAGKLGGTAIPVEQR